jgi:hypothetical protein
VKGRRIFLSVFLLSLFVSLATQALANGVTLIETEGALTNYIFVDASPTPVFWDAWSHEIGDGPAFHAAVTYDPEWTTGGWLVHSDTDSLLFRGWWPEYEPTSYTWNFLGFDVDLTTVIEFDTSMRLTARRGVSGSLETNEHFVVLVFPDDSEVQLLGPDTQVNVAEITLPAGTYRMAIYVRAMEHGTHYAYSGAVEIGWEEYDAVPVEQAAWGSVKAMYR